MTGRKWPELEGNRAVMYDLIYRKKRLVQFILALITLPFAFFGVDYYFRGSGSEE